ncbi:alkylhydroperoxidase family enzyme [Kitasatospora gansuensis]|uniref:Alkylhydroperoxidase family enzyme n=1 Tax=Kitasatospora gansuensis TaxID=258050 RepID=A0A7W7SJR8_9ACTN|nr:carboxymuconolactone decarboxylase family protein [Kitasatospora gansuensis]MBB4951784.1 alkylhydroperoxidase family enzyme [Kitasatospora gansuensis]
MSTVSTPTTQAAPQLSSRMTDPTELIPELKEVSAALFKATGNRSVPRTTIGLVQLRAGQIVGNTYLTVLNTGLLRKAGETDQRLTALPSWRDATYFTDAERAALALVEAVLLPNPHGERVSDELYAEAARHYDPKALATLTVAIGQVNFFIPLALIGKPLPVDNFSTEQWT